ncbi:MAG: acetate--CoA ligase family protein [Planctomycetes bacterium]|jgi:acetyl coenzyme A synthetase (ADP forming)-like protein|nr:acetate--CoA ligase family protein [Planctomycetota bacterium]
MAHARTQGLDGLFRPRSVAVIGASRRAGSIGRQVVANLIAGGFQGPVYPVNPKAEVVLSVPAYPNVKAIPGPVDLAVLVVPPDAVLVAAEQCGKKGVKGLVVITAGFREIGGEGIVREEKLRAIADRYRMRVIGPNCMGIINTEPEFACNASFSATPPPPGSVAMVSQSGALGEAILADAAQAGLGVAMFASVGNRVDVTAADLVAYWGADDKVKVILLYLETVGEPQEFVQVAREVARKKPIIAVKSGRSDAGALAASSHTGSIAGADVAADTLLQQCGVLRVDNFRDMFALAQALLTQPPPKGPRMAVVTNAGGPGILATDALVGLGMEMATLAPATQKQLRKVLPPEASIHNPVDLIASADAARYRAALRPVARDPAVDGLVVLFVSPIMIDAAAVAQAIVNETRGLSKPVLACVMGRQRGDEAQQILLRAGIPVFRYPEDMAVTLRLMCRRHVWLERRPVKVPKLRVDKKAAARVFAKAGNGWLPAASTEQVLQAYGIPFAPSRRVGNAGEAVSAAHELGFPVVLKAEAAGLLHKSEYRAVRTGLRSGDEVYAAAQDLLERLGEQFDGVSLQVQAHAEGHREILLGMTRDPRYGPLFAAGLGGTQVELMRDVAVRVGPIDGKDPTEMFASLKGRALLGAFRGAPAADLPAACDALLRLQQLVLDFPAIAEVEVNPFILARAGKRSAAVDGRLRVEA